MVMTVIYNICPPTALQKHEPFLSRALRGGGRQTDDTAMRNGERKTQSQLEQRLHVVSLHQVGLMKGCGTLASFMAPGKLVCGYVAILLKTGEKSNAR